MVDFCFFYGGMRKNPLIIGDYQGVGGGWLSYLDSNQDRQNQKLQCYHYTIRQSYALKL